jgi:hypothetical protein
MHRRRHGRKTLGSLAVVATLIAAILVLPSISQAGAATPGGYKATALTPAQQNLPQGTRRCQRLSIGVDGDELDAGHAGLDHPVDGIAASYKGDVAAWPPPARA